MKSRRMGVKDDEGEGVILASHTKQPNREQHKIDMTLKLEKGKRYKAYGMVVRGYRSYRV